MKNKSKQYLLLAIVMFTVAICMATAIWKSVSDNSGEKGQGAVELVAAKEVVTHSEVVLPDTSVAPETEAALAQFGLSATSIVPIGVSAKVRMVK